MMAILKKLLYLYPMFVIEGFLCFRGHWMEKGISSGIRTAKESKLVRPTTWKQQHPKEMFLAYPTNYLPLRPRPRPRPHQDPQDLQRLQLLQRLLHQVRDNA